jgi:hypothetical protein
LLDLWWFEIQFYLNSIYIFNFFYFQAFRYYDKCLNEIIDNTPGGIKYYLKYCLNNKDDKGLCRNCISELSLDRHTFNLTCRTGFKRYNEKSALLFPQCKCVDNEVGYSCRRSNWLFRRIE